MGDTKLCLFLLFSAYALAEPSIQVSDEVVSAPLCPLATRYTTFKKYVYQYTAESTNGVTGTANTKNGPKISCKVELEVPQTCRFVLHTTECTLSEVTDVDDQGKPVYTQAPGSQSFQEAMKKSPLHFSVEHVTAVLIYPEKDEPENIVNIKRGIISALLVPLTDEEFNKEMTTIHGICPTDLTVNSRKDIDTDVTVVRDLRACSLFYPRYLHTSPLSLLPSLDGLISKLISGTQTCRYQFDNRRKHMTEALCTEKHVFTPFSHDAQYGITAEVKQSLILQESVKSNNRFFSNKEGVEKRLFAEEVEDKSFSQTKEDVITTMKTLNDLTRLGRNEERARLFHKLVFQIRAMKNETLYLAVKEMMQISKGLTWQALLQCGTSECTSAVLQVIRDLDEPAWEVDAIVYTVGLMPQPTPQQLRDMLSMAQHRPSKPIMYALANIVKKFPQNNVMEIPEVREVAEFMEFMLGDCSGDEDKTFLTLRVIGVMGKQMEGFPSLKSALLSCVSQRQASLSVQKSAIQAFRLMEIDSDVIKALLAEYQATEAPAQKRIAAYLILMRNPEVVEKVLKALKFEKNPQVKSFVVSHMTNLLDSTDPNLQTVKDVITQALQIEENFVPDFSKSHNYKLKMPMAGSVETNVIFDSADYMPREMMLATTLDILNADLLEIGLEGEGYDSTIEALFGENGFFPDAISKAMYWANDQAPPEVSKVLEKWISPLKGNRMKREVTQNIMEQIKENFDKFKEGLQYLKDNKDSTKAMAYLRFLGTELGYMKTSELTGIMDDIMSYINIFFKDILSVSLKKITTRKDNELFAHYMFLDQAFNLPTGSGFPLKFSLAGVFAPGAIGGLNFARGMQQLSFRPSVGVEFITHMGIYLPEYINAGIRLHTNIYHESGLNAKISMSGTQVKLSFPVPKENTQLISISNELISLTSSEEKKVPSMLPDRMDYTGCNLILPGMKYCTIHQYYKHSSNSPYFPLTGDSRFAVELQPTGEVSEYTAALTYELLREGKEGRHKVDSLVLSLKAEGSTPTEATAKFKYNRNKNTLSSEFQIPDIDVEAAVKLAVIDSAGKGKMRGITIDVSSRESLQLSLAGRARMESMKNGLLELELAVPALQLTASATASLNKVDSHVLQLETMYKMPEMSSLNKVLLKYDENQVVLEIGSDMNSEIAKLTPNLDNYRTQLQQFIDEMLDQQVAKTDMKLRHIVSKGIEAANIWLEKFGTDIPYLKSLRSRRSLSDLTLPCIPETLSLKYDTQFLYKLKNGKVFFSLPLPFAGKSTEDLKLPSMIALPRINVPCLGLDVPETKHKLPLITIPESLDFSLPMIDMVEASAKVSSNLGTWEGLISAGNFTVDVPSYIAKYKIAATCPVTLFSYEVEGMAMIGGTLDDTLKYHLNGSLHHSFLDASFSIVKSIDAFEKLRINYKAEATGPCGLQTSLICSTQAHYTGSEITSDTNVDSVFKIGPLFANTAYTKSINIDLKEGEGKAESTLSFDSTMFKSQTVTQVEYDDKELSIVSKTNSENDVLMHVAELKCKDGKLSLKSDANAKAPGKAIRLQTNLNLAKDKANFRVETQANDGPTRAFSLLMGSLNGDGLEVNIDGSLNLENKRGAHKGTLTVGRNGLATSCTTTLLCSSMTFEKTFNAGIDRTGASMSLMAKGSSQVSTGELNVEGKISENGVNLNSIFKGTAFSSDARSTMNLALNKQGLTFFNTMMGTLGKMRTESTHTLDVTLWTLGFQSKIDALICDGASYNHDVKVNLKPFVASLNSNCKLDVFDLTLKKEGNLKMEPFKIDATGSITGKYKQDNTIKTTCGFSLIDLSGSMKCDSTGEVLDSQISHNFDLEFAGLASVLKSETRLNSRDLRLENTIRTMAMPFSLTIDAILNSDGSVNFCGKHSGQLYSKFLLKAEPFAIAKSHDWRASATIKLPNGNIAETQIENKCDGLLMPNEQSMSWKLKSKLNNHAYNQDVSIYNKEMDMGAQLSGVLLTNLFNKAADSIDVSLDNQEFSVFGSIKYDKNKDCHMIDLPFIESLPVALEKMKTSIVSMLESLQKHLNGLDLNYLVRQFKENLDKFPKKVGDFIEDLDLENKLNMAKDVVVSLAQDYAVNLDDLEASMENLKTDLEKALIDLATKIRDLKAQIKDFIQSGSWTDILKTIGDELKAFDTRNHITSTILEIISAIEDVIGQIDLQKLHDSSMDWLKKLDAEYDIRAKIQDKISELKEAVENFDITKFIQDVIDYLSSADLAMYLEQLSDHIPSDEIKKVIDSIKDVVFNWIEEYEVVEKLNYVYSIISNLFQKYEIEKRMEDFVKLVKNLFEQYKIQETVEAVVDTLKSIPTEYYSDRFMTLLNSAVSKLKSFDIKKNLDDLNDYIQMIIKKIKDFDYDKFVDEANKKISQFIDFVNEQIQIYEIPQKIEASREFLRKMQESVYNYIEQLKNTKVAELYRILKGVIDTTAYKDIKLKIQDMLEDLRQRINDMDIGDEIEVYLQRASESYTNMIAFISSKFKNFIELIRNICDEQEILDNILQAVEGFLSSLKMAGIETPAFTLPFTSLEVPNFKINMASLQDITIPSVITVPEFKILDCIEVPSITIDFEMIKQKIIEFIDHIRDLEIPELDPEDTFGDLRVLYLFDLPDFTFLEFKLVDMKFPDINIPKLNVQDFEITMLPIPEVKLPKIQFKPCIPAFGKLSGQLQFNSPHYTMKTVAEIQNTTVKSSDPQFKATLNSQAKSTIDFLGYSLDAMLQIACPKKKKMVISETMKVTHVGFNIDHEGSLVFSGPSAEAKVKTSAKATTEPYKADLSNEIGVALKDGISLTMDTTYNHKLNIACLDFSNEATFRKTAKAQFESGTISLTCKNVGDFKWSYNDLTDEGIHKSNLEFSVNTGTAKLTMDGETNSKLFKIKKSLNAESVLLSHIKIDASAETETPFIKKSVMRLTGTAQTEGLKIELTASHDAELTGKVSGTLSNSCDFLAQPFEIALDCKNKGNSKITLPLKLTGKIDLQHDYKLIFNSKKQHTSCVALARFNQYKYNHNFTLENNEMGAGIYASVDGEANLDFLTVPLNIPEMTVPYFEIKTPKITGFSLWNDLCLKDLLTSPQQSFDIDFKLHYQKNPEKHTLDLDLEPFYNFINDNAKNLGVHFEHGRDAIVDALTSSYNKARSQFEKYNIDTSNQPPRYFTVPGYTIPFLNIEVSAFRAELPAVGFFMPKELSTPSFKLPILCFSVPSYTLVLPSLGLPVLNVPKTLKKLKLPTFTLPEIQNSIMIPALGNLTYDFTFKSPVITVSSNGGLYNQSDLVIKLGATSTSVFDLLKGKLDGTTSITKKRCLKVATTLSLEHKNAEYNHDSSFSLTKRNIETSWANVFKVKLPVFTMELNQQLSGNTKTKPNIASNLKLQYTYRLPLLKAEGKGNMEHALSLETLLTHFSLESILKGKTDGKFQETGRFSDSFNNEATIYLNINGLRSTVKTDITSDGDYKKNKIWNLDITKNFELEASLKRIYATITYTSNNKVNTASFSTNGKHLVSGLFEFVPLTTLSSHFVIDISQPSSLGFAGLAENMDLAISLDKQKFVWNCTQKLGSVKHFSDLLLSNDVSEIRMEYTKLLLGYVAFLKSIKLPVYQKSLWDVLKFDETTSTDQLQSFSFATHWVYTKSMDGILLTLPSKVFDKGLTFKIPVFTIPAPNWLKQIPHILKDIDKRLENADVPDSITIPPAITIPSFNLPFTSLQVPSFTIDPKSLKIPNVIKTNSFDITLPALPKVKVPSIEISTKYLKDKMALLFFKFPKYEITISPLTLPKSFTIGEHTISLDDIIKSVCNFEMPAITIPEQKLEIPEISLHLPVGVFIPAFGALSTTVKVSSPIYNKTMTAKMENKAPGFVYTLKSNCISTMTFLVYDLEAVARVSLDNGALNLDGKCTLSHNDLKVNWKHDLQKSLRVKREEPSASRPHRHTLDIDVISQTFADIKFHFASHSNGITSSVSSPAGFVGFQFTKRSNSQYYGKFFTRTLSSTDKDTDLLSFKITLKNSDKLNLQTSWHLNGFFEMVNGFKAKLPDITAAIRDFFNKYHKAHFGIDLNRAAVKFRNAISNSIDRAYSDFPKVLDSMQNSIEQLSQQSKDMLKQTMKSMPEINCQDLINKVTNKIKDQLQTYESNVRVVFDAIMKFLSETKFQLPGFEEKLTGQELYYRMRRSLSTAIKRAAGRFTSLMETIADAVASFIKEINFSIPGTNLIFNGREMMENLKSAVKSAQDDIIQAMKRWEGMKLESLLQNISDLIKRYIQSIRKFINSLKTEQFQDLSSCVRGIYSKISNTQAMQSITKRLQEAKTNAIEYKDKAQQKIQDFYNDLSLDSLNSAISDVFSFLEKHIRTITEDVIEFLKKVSQHTQPYVKVNSKKIDIDIPLPFYWNSFSDWPSMT
ncbi:apolipoprotein B-100 [Trichomycterus rosablanca]|uniref:apolipoprotein B-100 n=1 Tax=Trichomycterus rosablanca TaxID=2290929 RepID=UPI002F35610B